MKSKYITNMAYKLKEQCQGYLTLKFIYAFLLAIVYSLTLKKLSSLSSTYIRILKTISAIISTFSMAINPIVIDCIGHDLFRQRDNMLMADKYLV